MSTQNKTLCRTYDRIVDVAFQGEEVSFDSLAAAVSADGAVQASGSAGDGREPPVRPAMGAKSSSSGLQKSSSRRLGSQGPLLRSLQ